MEQAVPSRAVVVAGSGGGGRLVVVALKDRVMARHPLQHCLIQSEQDSLKHKTQKKL